MKQETLAIVQAWTKVFYNGCVIFAPAPRCCLEFHELCICFAKRKQSFSSGDNLNQCLRMARPLNKFHFILTHSCFSSQFHRVWTMHFFQLIRIRVRLNLHNLINSQLMKTISFNLASAYESFDEGFKMIIWIWNQIMCINVWFICNVSRI